MIECTYEKYVILKVFLVNIAFAALIVKHAEFNLVNNWSV